MALVVGSRVSLVGQTDTEGAVSSVLETEPVSYRVDWDDNFHVDHPDEPPYLVEDLVEVSTDTATATASA